MNKHLLGAAIAAALSLSLAAQDTVFVKGGKVVTVSGPVIENGVVAIANGRITKVGSADEVEVPWDAQVVDATGKVVMPTWVLAHSQGSLRSANENMQNVPYVSVADAIDPASTFFEDCLRNGVGTIHILPGNATLLGGIGMIVRPAGRTVEDMAVRTRTGVKLSLQAQGGARLQQVRRMRRALEEIREYLADFDRRKAEFEKEKAAGAVPADKEWTEEYDRLKKPGIDLVQKKLKGWLFVPSTAEVDEALRLAEELELAVVVGQNVEKAAAKLARFKAPVVLDENLEFWTRDEETDVERKVCTPKLLADAGVGFALSLGASGPTSYPWWQLATCVRNGVDRKTAVEALTMVPAQMLGIADDVGSLSEGKFGNLQILSGDPMAATTWVETVLLEGKVVYERSKDQRLQYLLKAPEPAPAKPANTGNGGD
ncbi:MAG: Atrazine chlorohydrolase [Planctomycetota bacterium]